MTKEEDDLYADLYSEDVGEAGDKSGDHAGDDSIYDEEVVPNSSRDTGNASGAPASSSSAGRSSFIPAAKPSQSSGSSFIPADPTKPSGSSNVAASTTSRSFIPSTSTPAMAPAANTSRIQTAPMTNADSGSKPITTYSGGDQGYKQLLPHEMPDEGKLFVGGLNWETTDEGLKHYFSQFGKVNYCLIMRDPSTQRSRGFAFLTFDDPKAVNSVMVKEHYLDGKIIDPKRAIPRQENIKTAKCFVGGIPGSATPESFKAFFEQYGNVLDSTLMMDRETQKPRGYGFVTFDNDTTVERLLSVDALVMDGKMVEVKRATPRNADGTKKVTSSRTDSYNLRGSNDNAASTSSSSMNGMDPSMFMQGGGVNNPMAAAAAMMMGGNPMFAANQQQQSSFDPQMMAQFFQQQNWGNANFNPMAFQQMMMGGMGMGGGMGGMGGWGGGAGMSPWMGGGMNMGNMSPSGAASSPNPSNTGASSTNRATSQQYSGSQDRGGSAGPTSQSSRGRNNLQAPSSAGLPTRPNTQDNRSPNAGRDYSREKSPERERSGGNSRGSSGYNRDSRW